MYPDLGAIKCNYSYTEYPEIICNVKDASTGTFIGQASYNLETTGIWQNCI